jgi:hypothetical protein
MKHLKKYNEDNSPRRDFEPGDMDPEVRNLYDEYMNIKMESDELGLEIVSDHIILDIFKDVQEEFDKMDGQLPKPFLICKSRLVKEKNDEMMLLEALGPKHAIIRYSILSNEPFTPFDKSIKSMETDSDEIEENVNIYTNLCNIWKNKVEM